MGRILLRKPRIYQSCSAKEEEEDAPVNFLKNNINIYIKIYFKTAPTFFGVTVTALSGSALIIN